LVARLYLGLIGVLGTMVLFTAITRWESPDLLKFSGYLLVAICFSGLRIRVPGIKGTLSLNVLFVLFGLIELTPPQTVALGTLLTVVQCFWNQPRKPRPAQVLFNVTAMALAIGVTEQVYHAAWMLQGNLDPAVRMAVATLVLFVMNTVPVALALTLIEQREFFAAWREGYFWALPYYLGGAAIAGLASLANRLMRWETVLLAGPVVYLIYRSYLLYLDRLEEEKTHAEGVSSLHLRTIEALALAIEAKDHTTHDHLQRVQVYAMELAKDLGLSFEEQEALRAAALLHDIGKLAVPEHIISKPGRLTPEEFEKMKIHPIVGAEILERVKFPYPVVPIVRAHHEKWDGSGYPYGLSGEQIPIGARILSAVDCLDAIATERQYRRALPLDDAMQVVKSESGKAFDPRVVQLLFARYAELEKMARQYRLELVKLSTDVNIDRGATPAAGFEASKPSAAAATAGAPADFLSSIAAARQEVQALFEISQELGNSLSLDETLSVLAVRLRRIIPHHALAIWVRRGDTLLPEYVTGDDFRLFSNLEIPMGQGLSGWVAENRKPILNGNPSVESGYLDDPTKTSMLRSAVAVPLEGGNGVLGVLSVYHTERDGFTKDHLRILLAITSKIAMSIENALRFRQAESSATTDYLTALPNARSLFLQLDAELSRSRRSEASMALVVLDLDGFKQINDRFGHLEGNRVLRVISAGLKASCREYDYVARMGGDEFVVLLAGATPSETEAKLAHFHEVVRSVCRQLFADDSLTVSAGVAHFPADGNDAEQLLAEADKRMYKEKRARKQHQVAPDSKLIEQRASAAVIQ
jgi:diguanylate cyclase (GGDEF)-like protein/putative nucleotidyltransferase with HDIG domain